MSDYFEFNKLTKRVTKLELLKIGYKITFRTNQGLYVINIFRDKEWTLQDIAESIIFYKVNINWDVIEIKEFLGGFIK